MNTSNACRPGATELRAAPGVASGGSYAHVVVGWSRSRAARTELHKWAKSVQRAWLRLQVSQRGAYSIERMLALEEYSRTTSLLRALLVCIVTPLPMIATVVLLESVPLARPEDGWRDNYGVWIRLAVLGASIAWTQTLEMENRTKGIRVSAKQLLVIGAGFGASHSAVGIAFAEAWAFPIPFTTVFVSTTCFPLLLGLLRLVLGQHTWKCLNGQRDQVTRLAMFFGAQLMAALLYQPDQAVFQAVNGTSFELPVVLLLPIIKLLTKNVVAHTVNHLEDLIPESVIFTVELFNALYVAMCMQMTPSPVTISVIVGMDLAQTVVAAYELDRRTAKSLVMLRHMVSDLRGDGSLLNSLRVLCEHSHGHLDLGGNRDLIRLRSCIVHKLSEPTQTLLDSFKKTFPRNDDGVTPMVLSKGEQKRERTKTSTQQSWTIASTNSSIVPIGLETAISGPVITPIRLKRQTNPAANTNSKAVLEKALRALFTSECLVLSEYLESIIPVVYGAYILVMVHLPSAQYHGELDGITEANVSDTLSMVFLYALLEVTSLVVLGAILWRNCRLNAIYHLAFVLETHVLVIQIKLAVWLIAASGLKVTHFGVDYSFQFA